MSTVRTRKCISFLWVLWVAYVLYVPASARADAGDSGVIRDTLIVKPQSSNPIDLILMLSAIAVLILALFLMRSAMRKGKSQS